MSDYRQNLMQSIDEALLAVPDRETREHVSRKILTILGDYEVMKRATELVVYDDRNERLIKKYAACMAIDGKSQKTIEAYTGAIRRFAETIGISLLEVGVYDIRFYLAVEKERGISDRTLENTRSYLSTFYQWLAAEEIIPKNPAINLKPIKYTSKEKQAFSAVEMDALRHACSTLKERALVEMLATSGIRVSELVQMDVSDLDLQNLTVHVKHGKGAKERTTYINDVAKMHVQKYLASRSDKNPALFGKGPARLTAGGVRYILNQIAKRAGVEDVHPHRFRRTFATGLAARGMPIQEVQRLLGHENINTTMTYVCVNDFKVKASYAQYIA